MDIELTGNYPIIIDGQESGSITVTHQGLYWIFTAKCEMQKSILRLSVYGDGAEGYLGVMIPESDGLSLNKKLSREALKDFPRIIDYAGKSGEAPPKKNIEEDSPAGEQADEEQAAESDEPEPVVEARENDPKEPTPQEGVMPPPEAQKPQQSPPEAQEAAQDPPWRPCALPCSLFSDIGAKSASGEIKGAMTAKDGGFTLLAVPLSLAPQIGQNSILCFNKSTVIDGNTYVVCKIKNGKPYEAL